MEPLLRFLSRGFSSVLDATFKTTGLVLAVIVIWLLVSRFA